MRLVHGEADGLPGLIVDRYADTLVAQFLSAGAERWKAVIADALCRASGLARLYERSDASVRGIEGLALADRLAARRRRDRADDPRARLAVHGRHRARATRRASTSTSATTAARFAEWVRPLRLQRVLNCYCYTGGFTSPHWPAAASEVLSVDSSAPALSARRRNVRAQRLRSRRAARALDADVNATLRAQIEQGASFDAIVLDPPKFAPTVAHAERAARAYKDINRLALKLLAPGGAAVHASRARAASAPSCSTRSSPAPGSMPASMADRCTGSRLRPTTRRRCCFPEGEYLKGLALLKQ